MPASPLSIDWRHVVTEVPNPSAGTAVLHYDPWTGFKGGGGPEETLAFHINAPPWQRHGRQPYAWQYTPSQPPDFLPSLLIALDRTVQLRATPDKWRSP